MPLDVSPFGVNSHKSPKVLEIFAGIGVRWHRIDISWDEIEAEEGRPHWDEIDRLCDAAARFGLSLLGSIAYTPTWASHDRHREAPPLDPSRFAAFAGQVASRYRNRIAALSVWNEPNLKQFWAGSREQYLRLLSLSLVAIRDAAPEVLRCGPDLSGWSGNANGKAWLKDILAVTDVDPRRPLLDVITHHQYAAGDTSHGRVKEIDRLHDFVRPRDLEQRPVWITEIGWDTGKVPNESQRGAHLRDVMAAMRERTAWWQKTFWYDSHGLVDGTGPARWGLLIGPETASDFGEPLPSFFDFAEVVLEDGGAPPGAPVPGPVGPISDADALRLIDAAYRGVLGRSVDPEGLRVHRDLVRQGAILAFCRVLFDSAEFKKARLSPEALAARLYTGILGRDPDPGGFSVTVAELRAERGPQRVADMLQGPEFRNDMS